MCLLAVVVDVLACRLARKALFSSRQSRALFLPPASWHLSLTVFCCIVRSLKKDDYIEKCARFVLFRLIKKRSFDLLCVLDPNTATAFKTTSPFGFIVPFLFCLTQIKSLKSEVECKTESDHQYPTFSQFSVTKTMFK